MAGFALNFLWDYLADKIKLDPQKKKILGWSMVVVAVALTAFILPRYPIAMWQLNNYAQSPISFSYMADQGIRLPVAPAQAKGIPPMLALYGGLAISALLAFGLALIRYKENRQHSLHWKKWQVFVILLLLGTLIMAFNTPLSNWLMDMNTNWLFIIAIVVSVLSVVGLGALMEKTMIQPLYSRPVYQLMLTLGLGTIGMQLVKAIWGMPEFVLPKPEFFRGAGAACPATSIKDIFTHNCSTIMILGGRVRVYDEIVLPIIGITVLILVWLLLKKTRIGMIIRAGVQDSNMVEALGINVRRVFTFVFALGAGLAALGGVLSAPSNGLSVAMGEKLLLNALIALAIGGLTSYPGAALGSLMVGLIQQFMIKYGQIGIPIPFTDIIFKPTPAIIPASTMLLMVIVLLILPNGLLGRQD
jgi:branched-chain amino acid transport system permease protein